MILMVRKMCSRRTMASFAHLLKGFLGCGILAMPFAFQSAGMLVGVIGTVVICSIGKHCIHIYVSVDISWRFRICILIRFMKVMGCMLTEFGYRLKLRINCAKG